MIILLSKDLITQVWGQDEQWLRYYNEKRVDDSIQTINKKWVGSFFVTAPSDFVTIAAAAFHDLFQRFIIKKISWKN